MPPCQRAAFLRPAERNRPAVHLGSLALGYEVRDRKLVIHEAEAATVRMIFECFLKVGSATTLARSLSAQGVRSRRGKLIDKGFLYELLKNRVYLSEAVHKGTSDPGEHLAIIGHELWDTPASSAGTRRDERSQASRNSIPRTGPGGGRSVVRTRRSPTI